MDREKASEILHDSIRSDNGLYDLSWYLEWIVSDDYATLDGTFTADELEAIAWWMRNNKKEGEEDGQKTT